MIDKEYNELINKAVDGLLTDIEAERLNDYLVDNLEAKHLYDELVQMSELLDKIPKVEPSPGIIANVMNSIERSRRSIPQKKSTIKSLMSNLLVLPSPKLAYAFGLGLVIGFLVNSGLFENMISKIGMDAKDISGTIGIKEQSDFKLLKNLTIALSEINGTVSVKHRENTIVFETNLSTPKESELRLEYDRSHVQFSHFDSDSQSKISLDFGENFVQTSFTGNPRFLLYFTGSITDSNPIILNLYVGGDLCYTQVISVQSS